MKFKAYKYRIYPTVEQRVLIHKHIGCARYIYNYGLDLKTKSYQVDGKGISRFDISATIPALKSSDDTCWLKEVNAQTLQASLEHLDKAFTRFFKEKKGFPKFKSKKNPQKSFAIPQNTRVYFEGGVVSIPKFKQPIKVKYHRRFDGIVKTSTISVSATGKYYISILVELADNPINQKPICESKAVGIDLGIKTFAVLSDGTEIENPKHLRKSLVKLKKAQRQLSKKVKGSANREKARRKVAVLHERVANRRSDFLHKTTHFLVSNYDTLCLETLAASNMMKNHKLAQALSDIAIGRFNEILEYKAAERGVNILRIGRFEPSSKMCTCGTVNKDLKLSHRVWTCQACGATHDRDLLAANNIKRFAFSKNHTAGAAEIQACGEGALATSAKQETYKSLACG